MLCIDDHVDYAILPPIMRTVLDKVVRPHVIAVLWPKPDARTIGQPKPSAFWLLGGYLQPLKSPNPLDAFVIDDPVCPTSALVRQN